MRRGLNLLYPAASLIGAVLIWYGVVHAFDVPK